jgi:hypothetical protein
MPQMPNIPFQQALNTHGHFLPGRPIGVVLHRTGAHYEHVVHTWTIGPNPDGKSIHFLIGKHEYQIVQVVDTNTVANHTQGANPFFIGVEFESIPVDDNLNWSANIPRLTNDPLTVYQASMGNEVLDWISRNHAIPKVGPPSLAQLNACRGRWHGFMSHQDVFKSQPGSGFTTGRSEDILREDYYLFGIWPAP